MRSNNSARLALAALIAAAASAQTVKVENTGKVGRRVENKFYVADLSPQATRNGQEDSGTLRALTFKEFNVTLQRDPANGRMHKGASIQRVGARSYLDLGNWDPVQEFREERKDGVYIHHREGYFRGYPEVRITAEYQFPPNAPYFIVTTVMTVEKPIRVSLVRNNEMTMDLFFTHFVRPPRPQQAIAFDDRQPILDKEPIPTDAPWLAFVNPAKGYGFGFVNLGSKATKTAKADTFIADGFRTAGGQRTLSGRYFSRHLIWESEVDLVPGDRFEEKTAYVLFHSTQKDLVGDLLRVERDLRVRNQQ
jgi:hypothetical protein